MNYYGKSNCRRLLGRRRKRQNHRYSGGRFRYRCSFPGGSNAGHTIITNYGRFALHQLPLGIFRKNILNIIGNGVALSVENFIDELKAVTEQGVPMPNILISNRCQIVMPYHKALDGMEEARLASKSFGSTKERHRTVLFR